MHTPIRMFFFVLLLVASALGIDQSDITGILREMTKMNEKFNEMDGRFSQGFNEMKNAISDLVIALNANVKYSKDQHDFGSVRLEVLRNVSTKKKIHRGKR